MSNLTNNLSVIPKYLFDTPANIKIKKGNNGYGLFSEKKIKAGDFVYKEHFVVLPLEEKDRVISFIDPYLNEEITHIAYIHGVGVINGWEYYGFSSTMNHSCYHNITGYKSSTIPNTNILIALNDIDIGEEIVCNYNLIYSTVKPFLCNCKSSNCLGYISGFNNLTTEQQKIILPFSRFK